MQKMVSYYIEGINLKIDFSKINIFSLIHGKNSNLKNNYSIFL